MDERGKLSTLRVFMLGASVLGLGTLGFYSIPGMIVEDAKGTPLVNAFYCSVVTLATVGYGDICPGELTPIGKVFIILFALGGIGIFVGPILDLASSWRSYVPGGLLTLLSLTVGIGVAIFTMIEGISQSEAIYASIVTGTTIGYGDIRPSTDLGKIAISLYIIAVVNVVAAFLAPARQILERLCRVDVEVSSKES